MPVDDFAEWSCHPTKRIEGHVVIPAELIVGNDLALDLRRKHGGSQQTQYCGLWQLSCRRGNAEHWRSRTGLLRIQRGIRQRPCNHR